MYPDEPAVSLVATFFSLGSVGLDTSFSGEIVTTLHGGGEILLGLALRGETLLDLDCLPGRGLESTDLELAPDLPLAQSLLRGERPLFGLIARQR